MLCFRSFKDHHPKHCEDDLTLSMLEKTNVRFCCRHREVHLELTLTFEWCCPGPAASLALFCLKNIYIYHPLFFRICSDAHARSYLDEVATSSGIQAKINQPSWSDTNCSMRNVSCQICVKQITPSRNQVLGGTQGGQDSEQQLLSTCDMEHHPLFFRICSGAYARSYLDEVSS